MVHFYCRGKPSSFSNSPGSEVLRFFCTALEIFFNVNTLTRAAFYDLRLVWLLVPTPGLVWESKAVELVGLVLFAGVKTSG